MVPAPTTLHQFVSQNIEMLLVAYVRATRCGRVLDSPVDVVLGEGDARDVLQPDIVFVSREKTRYEQALVPEYWIVDSDRETVDVFRLGPERFAPAERYRRGADIACGVLLGFRIPVDEIFKRWD